MAEPYTILHGGFHKTASTFIQKTLQRNQGYLAKNGVQYVHHRHIRKQYTVPCQENAYAGLGIVRTPTVSDSQLALMADEFFAPMLNDPADRLILSDENLAGHCGHCVKRGQLYRWKKPFIQTFADYLPLSVNEIHLAVRNYADFFAAAYVQFIRSLQTDTRIYVSSRDMCELVFKNMPGWNGVINVVSERFPDARIFVWRYEDFASDTAMPAQILQNLVGPDINVQRLKAPKSDSRRQSASGRAVAEIEFLVATQGIAQAAPQVKPLQEQYPRNEEFGGFDPWEPWERAHLTRLYDRDMTRLKTNKMVTLVGPDM